MTIAKIFTTLGAAGLALAAYCGTAAAADFGGGVRDEPREEREFTYSFNIGAWSDYRFRGISQSADSPVIQGGLDIGYGIWYAGIWGSGINFGDNANLQDIADLEIDIYTGIKPVYHGVTFDLGIIYYAYPDAKDDGDPVAANPNELDYIELKLGASTTVHEKLALGIAGYYSPEYSGELGTAWEVDANFGYTLPNWWVFTPVVGGYIGYQKIEQANFDLGPGGDDDSYVWWNAGLALTVDKLTLDFRYWDTDISDDFGACSGRTFQCDATFVFSAKVVLP